MSSGMRSPGRFRPTSVADPLIPLCGIRTYQARTVGDCPAEEIVGGDGGGRQMPDREDRGNQ